ncbi:HigA family addiction module antitoxin [Dasania marina]|uniref:HigA family addiction module antitoxin n=1 Tax=Dasania marina TaxID=471499 RepID=UPI0030D82CB7|tara:strand:- start:1853 stop:2158 length:306 start_codon:yes stop_codon:yes gene_type:complete
MALQQHNPPHPGELINRTYIEPFDAISGNMVADRLGVARSTFNRLLNGVSDVSPEMAVKLSAVLGGSAESWLTLQESYDLWKARQSVDTKKLEPIDFSDVA